MDDDLRRQAQGLLAAAPCSVEMPAGTGKTHLLAASAVIAAEERRRSLILTHTNAGVDAIRRRLATLGVKKGMVRVDTITSWAFALVRSYSDIAQLSVPELPDWSLSGDYIIGATRVISSRAIREVHEVSFDLVLIDEYQDCTQEQHEFVLALAAAVPKTIVLGDRLQAIFGFAGSLASWADDVLPLFPAHVTTVQPYRWKGHNESLGNWLLNLRPQLVENATFDVAAQSPPGLRFVRRISPTTLSTVAYSFRNVNESVLLLDKWPRDIASHASRLSGSYLVMEDMGGNFMRQQLQSLPSEGDYRLAAWLARFSKGCVIGLAGLDQTVLGRLDAGQGIGHYSRNGLADVLVALDCLRTDPTYECLVSVAATISGTKGLRLYRWEAWHDTCEAIARTVENGEPVTDNLAWVRDRLRRTGRKSTTRIASRTVLVKGLEYDHVIIADLAKFTDPRDLYVALSRARKSITVIGQSSRITLQF
jgi:hypothetical protein